VILFEQFKRSFAVGIAANGTVFLQRLESRFKFTNDPMSTPRLPVLDSYPERPRHIAIAQLLQTDTERLPIRIQVIVDVL